MFDFCQYAGGHWKYLITIHIRFKIGKMMGGVTTKPVSNIISGNRFFSSQPCTSRPYPLKSDNRYYVNFPASIRGSHKLKKVNDFNLSISEASNNSQINFPQIRTLVCLSNSQ
jgi:hypothetical protein